MRDIDEPHDAEDQRQPGREHGVEAADQHALHDDVEPVDHITPRNSRRDRLAGERAGRAFERDAALLQAIDVLRRP